MENKFAQFLYSASDASFQEFDNLPRLPLILQYENKAVEVVGLIDSGATVNVLPYQLGIELGAVWIEHNLAIGRKPWQYSCPSCFGTHCRFSADKVGFCLDKGRKCPIDFGTNQFFHGI